jgi:Dolichyl-phosphate-mannose-protein mannosyltransferase
LAVVTLHAPAGVSDAESRLLVRLVWGLAALLGVLLLAMALGPHQIGDYFTETDFYGAYADGARLLQHGHLDPARYGVIGPMYEVALALAGFVIRDLFLAAELLSTAATLVTLLCWAALLRRRADARVALFTALFLATNPYFFRYGYAASTDALAVALESAAVLFVLARSRSRAAAIGGALAGLAFLTRYNAIALLPAGAIVILAGGTLFPRRKQAALSFLAGFLAPVLPWVLFSIASGSHVSFQLHHNIAYEVFARSKGITWDDYQRTMQPQFKTLWDVIARDPGAVASRMAFNLFDHVRQDAMKLLGWPVAVVATLGLLMGLADAAFRRLWSLAIAWALLFLSLVPAFYSERYSLALLPLYLIPAAWWFASPRFALAVRGAPDARRWLKTALVLLPLGAAALTSQKLQARAIDQLPVEALESARVLRGLARPGDRVMARKPHVAFHAGVIAESFPFANTLADLADTAKRQHVRWLYFSWPEAETRPRFWYLLDTTGVVPGLRVRHVTSPHPSVLYEIEPGFGAEPAWAANDTVMALHMARAHLLVNPADGRSLATLGAIERAHDHLPAARDLLERASRLLPNDVQVWLTLGEVSLSMDDAAAGDAAFAHVETIHPGNVDARVGRGWASLMAQRREEAAARWRPVVAVTRDPATLARMSELFHSLGDRDAAAAADAGLARAGVRP